MFLLFLSLSLSLWRLHQHVCKLNMGTSQALKEIGEKKRRVERPSGYRTYGSQAGLVLPSSVRSPLSTLSSLFLSLSLSLSLSLFQSLQIAPPASLIIASLFN